MMVKLRLMVHELFCHLYILNGQVLTLDVMLVVATSSGSEDIIGRIRADTDR